MKLIQVSFILLLLTGVGFAHDNTEAHKYYYTGITLFGQGKYDEAIEAYNKSVELNSDYSDAWLDRGVALLAQDNYPEAIRCCGEASRLDPNDPDLPMI